MIVATRKVFKEHANKLLEIVLDVDGKIDLAGRDNY